MNAKVNKKINNAKSHRKIKSSKLPQNFKECNQVTTRTGKQQGGGTGGVVKAAEVNESLEWLRIANAQLRYYLHIPDPDSLSDEEWAMRLKELEWIREQEANNPREKSRKIRGV